MTLILSILVVLALFLLAWQVFVRAPKTVRRREQADETRPDWLTITGHEDNAGGGSGGGAVGRLNPADSSTSSKEFDSGILTDSGYNDGGLGPDEYQELVNIDSPSNTALIRVTAFEAEHCAMIIGAYALGQTAYEEAVKDVRLFLLAAAFSARHPNSIHSAESLASHRERVMNWPFPRPGGPRTQPE
ncbi:hypothetical protein AC1659_29205 [Rhodococcus erythropolis]|uniref:hypothetical protein n=1 Tax=Rhodococcus erythropolis TaxID=1833 RepID=UPI001BA60B76|nr:hypothetical protein [Rhodococcus erythropolis]MBS2993382.1 hypothetical protein [Rhodococcus erythropolis]